MAWLNLIVGFLRLGPLGLGFIASVILVLGYFLQVAENERNIEKRAALMAGPPPVVNITQYDRDRDVTEIGEVVVRAQAVMADAYRLTLEKNGPDDYAYMVPLVSPTAASDRVIFGVALYTSSSFTLDDVTPELMMGGVVGLGDYGPIVEFNGKVRSLGQWDELTDEALGLEGLTMAANSVVVWPYIEGREAALTPSETTIFGLLSKVAGAIGLLALAKIAMGGGAKPAPKAPPVERPEAFSAPEFATAPRPMRPERKPQQDPLIVAPKRRIGVRQALIGLVAGAFVLLLVSVIVGLVSDAAANDQAAAVPTAQEAQAQAFAATIVPDADPDRHWTEIDISGIQEWFLAKMLLAGKGDVDAQMTLGMIVGGFFVFLFVVRTFFRLRRSFQPKTVARFDSMGLN